MKPIKKFVGTANLLRFAISVLPMVIGASSCLPERDNPCDPAGDNLDRCEYSSDLTLDLATEGGVSDIDRNDALGDVGQANGDNGLTDGPSGDGGSGAWVVKGSVGTVGPPSGVSAKYRLVEVGFEFDNRTCGAKYCVTGGVVP